MKRKRVVTKLFGEERKEQSPEFNKRPQGAIQRAMAAKD